MSRCKCDDHTTKPPSECWPNDPDFLDGRTEVHLPSSALLQAYWDADILDVNGVPPSDIINATQAFDVRFRIELHGKLWACICGNWCFDMGFTPIGKGTGFDLSDHLTADALKVKGWEGCKTRCVELRYTVSASTIPADFCDGTLYEVGAKFQLHCCDKGAHVAGYEALEERLFIVAED